MHSSSGTAMTYGAGLITSGIGPLRALSWGKQIVENRLKSQYKMHGPSIRFCGTLLTVFIVKDQVKEIQKKLATGSRTLFNVWPISISASSNGKLSFSCTKRCPLGSVQNAACSDTLFGTTAESFGSPLLLHRLLVIFYLFTVFCF